MKNTLSKLFKYTIVGGSAAIVNWGVFFVGVEILHWYYLFAGLISFVIATLWNFIWARRFVFKRSKHSLFKESFLVYLVSFLALGIDLGTLYICVDIAHINELLGKIFAIGAAFVFNFTLRTFVIYKEH
ncbi:GtrA family protein [Helicobacter sp. MIT 05-5293]|uniref:Putative membrane protein YwcD n=1 Tax=uncultured Helicobacter sp. TaxID=175537 RepID=A0A650F328_9HELI|nr:GtrA family protein [Helicobacter sp. MIT 05-5293]QGT50225.1 putative membrane protein YwcD [uncultured Helicobacter sp.]TLD80815.1 GtrA family protein [Helicobacter sp. MIT 05-5293]